MNLCPPDCPCLLHSLYIVWWKAGCPCMTVCLCPNHLISVPTPCLECVHASVHVFMSTCPPMLAKPLWIGTWKGGFLCVALCVCPSHPACGPILWLKCVHASIHVYRSTWLQKCAPPPLRSYMETWVLLYGMVYVSQSPHFCSNTFFRMCTFISTCTYVNKFLCTPFALLHGNVGSHVWHSVYVPVSPHLFPHCVV